MVSQNLMQSTELQKPIFRWAGSKRKLLPTLIRYVPAHSRYVEPFVGSGCLFFALRPEGAVLGDINAELIGAYTTIRDSAELVARAIHKMPLTREYYYQLRAVNPKSLSQVMKSARFVYLNRFCFNGVYRTNLGGQFNVPRGVRTGTLPTRLELINWSSVLKGATFQVGDFGASLDHVRRGDFVYLDPPYSKPGIRNRGEYGYNSFGELDLPRLSEWLKTIDKRGATFLLSYRYSALIVSMFPEWYRRTVTVRRHVAGFVSARANVREVLFSNLPFSRVHSK
jgi:DNA adenine methylase